MYRWLMLLGSIILYKLVSLLLYNNNKNKRNNKGKIHKNIIIKAK